MALKGFHASPVTLAPPSDHAADAILGSTGMLPSCGGTLIEELLMVKSTSTRHAASGFPDESSASRCSEEATTNEATSTFLARMTFALQRCLT
mmetsp:Transcript_64465/g.197211  ORF Transcript_64465/g.197211 Transcript_64465/m.197211 type:complete len:93 (+) Transcript_64465:728-1006(+)